MVGVGVDDPFLLGPKAYFSRALVASFRGRAFDRGFPTTKPSPLHHPNLKGESGHSRTTPKGGHMAQTLRFAVKIVLVQFLVKYPHCLNLSSNKRWTLSTASGAARSKMRSPTKRVVQSWWNGFMVEGILLGRPQKLGQWFRLGTMVTIIYYNLNISKYSLLKLDSKKLTLTISTNTINAMFPGWP